MCSALFHQKNTKSMSRKREQPHEPGNHQVTSQVRPEQPKNDHQPHIGFGRSQTPNSPGPPGKGSKIGTQQGLQPAVPFILAKPPPRSRRSSLWHGPCPPPRGCAGGTPEKAGRAFHLWLVKTHGISFWLGEFTTHFRTYFSGD